MRSAAWAFAWEIRHRHRWGLAALVGYLLVLLTVAVARFMQDRASAPDFPGKAAGLAVVPLGAAFMYLIVVFTFGSSTDLSARESILPARMFTLPVRTAALVGWPMLYGAVAMAGLWTAVALLALRPLGYPVPVLWPALLAAAFLAWTQVLMWLPYGLPGMRVVVAILWLAVLVGAPQVAVAFEVPDTVLSCVFALLIPLAYGAGCVAVGRARRGDVPDWRGMFARFGQIARILPRRHDSFSSPARAQLWFEWRRHGWSLPLLVGILLPFAHCFLFVATVDMPEVVFHTLIGVLLLPPIMAGFVAATVSKSNPYVRDYYGVSAFTATRPMTSAALIAAKLKMAVGSTLAAWLLVVTIVPLALSLSGTWPVVLKYARQWVDAEGPLRAGMITLLVFLGLVVVTWKQLVQNLYIGLTGRAWVINSAVSLAVAFFIVVGPVAQWLASDKEARAALWRAAPAIAAVLVCLKLAAAVWLMTRLRRRRLVGDRALVLGVAGWLLLVAGVFALLAWLVPAGWASGFLLAMAAALVIPLTRLVGAPLALDWNRHR